ncbi:GNAT family N-acetyltransferase [Aeromonas sobria]|uniref:GNAT family N-acetyltransferase n=1 Tax=Aeromonas sobria TaxID=646 RepID=UPI0012FF13A9|nr:GNAT family N-acetyltransferase [Aeromonas sobria]
MMIRIATPDDVNGMFEVRTSVRENHMSLSELAALGITPDTLPCMLNGSGRGWVACEEDQVVAFVMADAMESTIFAMFVRQSHEGIGLGRSLMQAAETWLCDEGCNEVWLLTDANTEVRANGFYRHLGWMEDGIQDDGEVRFKKRLSN